MLLVRHSLCFTSLFLLLLACGSLNHAPVQAQESTQETAQEQPLSDVLMARWIASMNDLREWSDRLTEEDIINLDDGTMNFEATFIRAAKRHAEVRSSIHKRGFQSAEEWGRISSRVIWAAIAIQASRKARELEQYMQQWEAEVGSDSAVKEEDKAVFRHRIAESRHALDTLVSEVPRQDVVMVLRHEDAIRTLDRG